MHLNYSKMITLLILHSKKMNQKSFDCLQRTIDAALQIKELQNIADSVQ